MYVCDMNSISSFDEFDKAQYTITCIDEFLELYHSEKEYKQLWYGRKLMVYVLFLQWNT